MLSSYSTQGVNIKLNGSARSSSSPTAECKSYPATVRSLDTVIALLDTTIVSPPRTGFAPKSKDIIGTVPNACDTHIRSATSVPDEKEMIPERQISTDTTCDSVMSSPGAASPLGGDTATDAKDFIAFRDIKRENDSRDYSSEDVSTDRSSGAASPRRRARCKLKRKRTVSEKQRYAANLRERKRMLSLNEAFLELHEAIPTFDNERKMPRVDILRLAIVYIQFMREVVSGTDPGRVTLRSEHKDIRSKTPNRKNRRHKPGSHKIVKPRQKP